MLRAASGYVLYLPADSYTLSVATLAPLSTRESDESEKQLIMSAKETGQIYYGWKIVAAIFVLLTFTSGLSFYNHAIYLNALATQPAFDVRTDSMAVSIFFLTGGVVGLFVAKWVQDYDPRICISAGAIISFLSLSALAHVSAVWQLFVVYGFFGAGLATGISALLLAFVTTYLLKKKS